jgi:hypothetical protein
MHGLFNPEMPPKWSNHLMTQMTCYTAVIGTKLFSYIESLWETAEKDQKIQNDHGQKICKFKNKLLIQGHLLEDHKDMICKLSRIIKKQEKVLDMLTTKSIYLEGAEQDHEEWLMKKYNCLGNLEVQLMRELGSNSCISPDLLFLPPPLWMEIIPGVAWRGPTPVQVVSMQVRVIIKEVLSVVIMTVMLVVVQEGSIVKASPLVHH